MLFQDLYLVNKVFFIWETLYTRSVNMENTLGQRLRMGMPGQSPGCQRGRDWRKDGKCELQGDPPPCTGVIPSQLEKAGVCREGVLQASLVALHLPAELTAISWLRPLIFNLGCTLESFGVLNPLMLAPHPQRFGFNCPKVRLRYSVV